MKAMCLRHCRSPLSFLVGHWRAGRIGAFRMGLEHGACCLGCCWFLMALLFFGGVMNLYWIVGLAALRAAGEDHAARPMARPRLGHCAGRLGRAVANLIAEYFVSSTMRAEQHSF